MKKFPLILSVLLLVSALSACGDTSEAAPTDTAVPVSETENAADTEQKREAVGLPDTLDFGGETFHMLAFDWQGYSYYFFADEANGDVMNDAIFARTQTVEETLNVDLTYEMQPGDNSNYTTNLVKQTVLAGDDVYQMALFHCIDGIASSSSAGYLYNLDKLPYIDTKADWWNQEQMDVLRLGQNTYYAVNDFMIPCPYVIFFNKQMVTDNDMENPYQLVYDGKWTVDTFAEMARSVVTDLNGDGKMDWHDDVYGITANETSKYTSFMPAANQFITEMGDDGRIALALNTDKTIHLVDLFADLAKNDVCYLPATLTDETQLTINTGRLLFTLAALPTAETMRDYTVDYGILPYPKYDEQQERYYTMDWGGLMGIPTTIRNPEMVGAVVELLAYESGNAVIPTYYDVVLTGKLSRDEDAEKMLDLIFDTICYEVGGNYFGFDAGFMDLFYTLGNYAVRTKTANFESFYSKREKTAAKRIDSFYTLLEETEALS